MVLYYRVWRTCTRALIATQHTLQDVASRQITRPFPGRDSIGDPREKYVRDSLLWGGSTSIPHNQTTR